MGWPPLIGIYVSGEASSGQKSVDELIVMPIQYRSSSYSSCDQGYPQDLGASQNKVYRGYIENTRGSLGSGRPSLMIKKLVSSKTQQGAGECGEIFDADLARERPERRNKKGLHLTASL